MPALDRNSGQGPQDGAVTGPENGTDSNAADWWQSHAQAPTPLVIDARRWRLFTTGRDAQNHSRIVCIDVDPLDDMKILDRHFTPLLDLGPPGAFDTVGQGVSMVFWHEGQVHLYFMGMHLRQETPFVVSIGLAKSDDGLQFTRTVPGPVMSTGPRDPYFVSLGHVSKTADGFLSWYTSGDGWIKTPSGRMDPIYGLRQGKSSNGIDWVAQEAVIPMTSEIAGMARPWLMPFDGGHRLFFSGRGARDFRDNPDYSYRLCSVNMTPEGDPDGEIELLEFENPPQPGDWDYGMQAYPSVMPLQGGYVMFYNGDGFGRDGFGWATYGL